MIQALSYNKSLVKLDLSDCEVGEGSGTHVAGLVKNNNTLQELCLRGVKLGAAGKRGGLGPTHTHTHTHTHTDARVNVGKWRWQPVDAMPVWSTTWSTR